MSSGAVPEMLYIYIYNTVKLVYTVYTVYTVNTVKYSVYIVYTVYTIGKVYILFS